VTGKQLVDKRRALSHTQETLALELEITRATVARWEADNDQAIPKMAGLTISTLKNRGGATTKESQEVTGKQLANNRKQLGHTQETLAVELGITRATVARWEAKEDPIPKIARIAISTLENKSAQTTRESNKPKRGRPPTGENKERILVTADKGLIKAARDMGINLSRAAEDGIRRALDTEELKQLRDAKDQSQQG